MRADIEDMYHRVPQFAISEAIAMAVLQLNGFDVEIQQAGLETSDDMKKFIARYWSPWICAVYVRLKMDGICPWYVNEGAGIKYPVVPPGDAYTISFAWDATKRKRVYHLTWNSTGKNDPSIHWITDHRASALPGEDGTVHSALASLLPQYKTLLIIRESVERGETHNTQMSHIFEHHPPASVSERGIMGNNNHTVNFAARYAEEYVGTSLAQQQATYAAGVRARSNLTMHHVQQSGAKNFQEMRRRARPVMHTETEDALSRRLDTGISNSAFILPEHCKYVAPPRAHVGQDLLRHSEIFDAKVTALMDFPSEIFSTHSSNRTKAVVAENRSLEEALAMDRRRFYEEVIRVAFLTVYKDETAELLKLMNASISQINAERKATKDTIQLYPELDITIKLPSRPSVSFDTLQRMYELGIMTFEEFREAALRSTGFTYDHFQPIHAAAANDKKPAVGSAESKEEEEEEEETPDDAQKRARSPGKEEEDEEKKRRTKSRPLPL